MQTFTIARPVAANPCQGGATRGERGALPSRVVRPAGASLCRIRRSSHREDPCPVAPSQEARSGVDGNGTTDRGEAKFDRPEFLALLRKGDRGAYRCLIRRFHGTLVGVATAIIGSRAQAEEVVQEAWLSVFVGIDRFERRSSVATWLFAIVRNGARSRAMQESRLTALPTLEPEEEQERTASTQRLARGDRRIETLRFRNDLDPERLVAGRQLWARARNTIAVLPPRQKAVLVMRDIEALSAEAVCEALSISPENQRVLLHRARSRVRQVIERGTKAAPASGHDPGSGANGSIRSAMMAAERAEGWPWAS